MFKRLHDMFEFFRRDQHRKPYGMDMRYWAEKVEAADKCDGLREWSADQFCADVRDYFDQAHDEDDDPAAVAELWQEIDEQVCTAAGDSENHAWTALWEFEHNGFSFRDWERDAKV